MYYKRNVLEFIHIFRKLKSSTYFANTHFFFHLKCIVPFSNGSWTNPSHEWRWGRCKLCK